MTGRERVFVVVSDVPGHGAERFAHLRSYLSTTHKHDVPAIDALIRLFNGDPWMPPTVPAT